MNDAPFNMQPQRRPMGLFRSPALSMPPSSASTPIGGAGAPPNASARPGLPSSPAKPTPPIIGQNGGALPQPILGGGPGGPPATAGAGPGGGTAPLAVGAGTPTPVPNIPSFPNSSPFGAPTSSPSGAYSYGGPSMALLGMTDFPKAPLSATPMPPSPYPPYVSPGASPVGPANASATALDNMFAGANPFGGSTSAPGVGSGYPYGRPQNLF